MKIAPNLRTTTYRNVQWFRGGLVFKAHRLVYHPPLGLRVIKKKRQYLVLLEVRAREDGAVDLEPRRERPHQFHPARRLAVRSSLGTGIYTGDSRSL